MSAIGMHFDANEGRFVELGCLVCRVDGRASLAIARPFRMYVAALVCECGAQLCAFDTVSDTVTEATSAITEQIALPKEWAPHGSFLLKVQGNHLEAVHIVDGDYVLLHPQEEPEPGQVVAVLMGERVRVGPYIDDAHPVLGLVRGVLRVGTPVQIVPHPSRNVLAFPKPARLEDEDYKRFIRRQPCLLHYVAAEAHHVTTRGAGGSDYRTLPFCYRCHDEIHRIGVESFARKHNLDLAAEQVRYLEMYLAALKNGENLGAR